MSAHEKVEVAVPIEVRGEAPGIREGGMVEQTLHELRMECPAAQIPEVLEVNVNELNLGDAIAVSQLELPAGATILDEMEATVVHCIEPPTEVLPEEEGAEEAAAGEPEVIGEKEGDEEGGDQSE
jgi:large subunit ribosomal protein L25